MLQFSYTSDGETILFSQNFSQISSNSELDLSEFLSQFDLSTGVITQSTPVCIQITEQCGQELPGDILCDDQTSMIFVMSKCIYCFINIFSVGNILVVIGKLLL